MLLYLQQRALLRVALRWLSQSQPKMRARAWMLAFLGMVEQLQQTRQAACALVASSCSPLPMSLTTALGPGLMLSWTTKLSYAQQYWVLDA